MAIPITERAAIGHMTGPPVLKMSMSSFMVAVKLTENDDKDSTLLTQAPRPGFNGNGASGLPGHAEKM
jgi:hypothetical protein